MENDFELIPTVKMEIILDCNRCGVMAALSRKTWKT